MKQVVFITGCSTGIGRALALEFQRREFKVYASARKLTQITDLKAQGILIDQLDVLDKTAIDRVLNHLLDREGHIDILVNNAGYGAFGPLLEMPAAEMERQFATHVFAPLSLIQKTVPSMIRHGSGTIVNIGSVSGILISPFSGAYGASKAALHALSDALRLELAPWNIDVITVQPGAIRSNFGANANKSLDRLLKADSIYAPIESAMRERANMSQQNATSAEEFARLLVAALIRSKKRQKILRLGKGSCFLPGLKRWLPTAVLDRILSRRFGLDRLTRDKK